MSRRGIFPLVVCVFVLLCSSASAVRPVTTTKHDRDVIRFFAKHPSLAHTRAGQTQLWRILGHVAHDLRSLQTVMSVSAAVNSWDRSNELIRRYYGNTLADWENSCSSTEGGHGGFVWFNHLSYPEYGYSGTPGGNLQFKGGTFDGIIGKALVEAHSRGLLASPSQATFYTPLGQAIAGAQMILDGRRGEWTGDGC